MTRLYLAVGTLAGLLFGLWMFYLWAHGKGVAEEQGRQQAAALEAVTSTLEDAGKQNRADTALGERATEAVERVRTEYRDLIVYLEAQPLTPPSVAAGDPDALACPDYLADPWVRLWDHHGGAPGPAAPGPTG